MKIIFLQLRTAFRFGLLTLLIAGFVLMTQSKASNGAQRASTAAGGRKIILEVINRHFTVGKKIPSVYLRVFADGTAECHTEKYSGKEKDVAKSKVLDASEIESLKAIINELDMLAVKKRYELMHFVIDSWMEWDIKLQHPSNVQRIQVASFSPASARQQNKPYPDALVALGCSVLKIRHDVYEDENAHDVGCPDVPIH